MTEEEGTEMLQARPCIGRSFFRAHGLGNDYLVLGAASGPTLTPELARRICDRHRGVGADGIAVVVPDLDADARIRIFNADGSEAERSGNGVRIAALFLHRSGGANGEWVALAAGDDTVRVRVRATDREGVWDALAEMGRASFPEGPPFVAPGAVGSGGEVEIAVPGGLGTSDSGATGSIRVTPVSVGNPHAVAFGSGWSDEEVERYGPLIERSEAFPQGANVHFAEVVRGGGLLLRIWERGVGMTTSSGTSACAAAAAAVRNGLAPGGAVAVSMIGGVASVEVAPDWSLRLEGPIEEICEGELAPGLLRVIS